MAGMTQPPDLARCETMITPAYSPLMFGRPTPVRCPNKPTHTAAFPGEGSMSICGGCLPILVEQTAGQFTLKVIEETSKA